MKKNQQPLGAETEHTMTKTSFVIPRDSIEEVTYAVVHVEISDAAAAAGLCSVMPFLTALKDAITRWVKTTPQGQAAWLESSEDFNVGDLSNVPLDPINEILSERGVKITDIDVHSMDGAPEGWSFDTVLVNNDLL